MCHPTSQKILDEVEEVIIMTNKTNFETVLGMIPESNREGVKRICRNGYELRIKDHEIFLYSAIIVREDNNEVYCVPQSLITCLCNKYVKDIIEVGFVNGDCVESLRMSH
jgi:hypothetical protein